MIQIQLAKATARKLKICFYGGAGTGKTLAALSFPAPLVVDAEHGTDLYRGRPGLPAFHVAEVKTLNDLLDVVSQVERDGGKTWQTLVIDPISVFFSVEKTIASKNNTSPIDPGSWAKINNRFDSLYTRLVNLPVHLVIIAHEAAEYETVGGDFRRVGVKPDADKHLIYKMDFVLRFNEQHGAVVEKSRGLPLSNDGKLATVTWAAFESAANAYSVGATVTAESDEAAAARELDSFQNREVVTAFVMHWRGQSLTDPDLLEALKVERLSLWQGGREAADKAVQDYLDAAASIPPATPTGYGKAPAVPSH